MIFKKKKKVKAVNKVDTTVSEEEIKQTIKQLKTKLKSTEDTSLYAEIAKCYTLINQVDEAIENYELCLKYDKTLGTNYQALMKLYNIKRREAAEQKNEEEIQKYLSKIDQLMQLSKDTIRGRN